MSIETIPFSAYINCKGVITEAVDQNM